MNAVGNRTCIITLRSQGRDSAYSFIHPSINPIPSHPIPSIHPSIHRTHHYNKGVLQRKLKKADGEETWKKPPESINEYFLVFSKPIKKQEIYWPKQKKKPENLPNGLNHLKNSTWAYHILRISLIRCKQKAMMSSTFQVRESPIFYSWDKEKRLPLLWDYCPKRTKSVPTILLILMLLFRNKTAFHAVWPPLLSYKR